MTSKKTTRRALFGSLMSLLLCCSMLLGTTFAWFTDTVTSTGNIIKSGTLDVEMYWADGTKAVPADDSTDWKNASTGAIFNYDLWEPGYTEVRHIRIANVGNLALKYQLQIDTTDVVSILAEAIDVYFMDPAKQIPGRTNLDEADKVGTLKQILTGGITKARGDLEKDEDVELTIALKMQEDAGNEYQNLSIGSTFAVKLLATQMEAEIDSFGSDYDKESNYPDAPIANVTQLSDLDVKVLMNSTNTDDSQPLTLNAGYQFTPTETYEEVDVSDYKYWMADFAVSADQDIPGNAVALAGYYDAFCQYIDENWIALSTSETITAGTEIALIETMGVQVHYKDIGLFGNDDVGFCCGIAGLNAKAVAGTTINVELRLYETEEDDYTKKVSPENYVVIGSYSYTFPATSVSSQEELSEVLEAGASAVELAAGNYSLPASNIVGKKVTLIGSGDSTVVDFTKPYNVSGANITFKNMKFTGVNSNTMNGYGIQHTGGKIVYENCTFENAVTNEFYGDVAYIDCTFNGTYYVATYSVKNATFSGCTFDRTDSRALLVYSHGDNPVKVTVENCTFKAAAKGTTWAGDWVAAVEVDTTNIPTEGTTVTISKCTYDATNYNGIVRDKSAEGKANSVITVDGVVVDNAAIKTTGYSVVNP